MKIGAKRKQLSNDISCADTSDVFLYIIRQARVNNYIIWIYDEEGYWLFIQPARLDSKRQYSYNASRDRAQRPPFFKFPTPFCLQNRSSSCNAAIHKGLWKSSGVDFNIFYVYALRILCCSIASNTRSGNTLKENLLQYVRRISRMSLRLTSLCGNFYPVV